MWNNRWSRILTSRCHRSSNRCCHHHITFTLIPTSSNLTRHHTVNHPNNIRDSEGHHRNMGLDLVKTCKGGESVGSNSHNIRER